MKNDTPIHEKYPDLLAGDPDPHLARLVADLDTISTSAQPPPFLPAAIERAIMDRDVTTQSHYMKTSWSQRLRSWRPRPLRLNAMSATATLLVAVLLLTGAAYAVAPLLSSVFQLEQGLQHIDESKLGQEVYLSQTINGWTMTVERIYADDNRVVIGYTATGPQSSQHPHTHCSTL